MDFHRIFLNQKSNPPTDYRSRLAYLEALENIILERQSEICSALFKDFNKPEFEVYLSEIYPCLSEIRHTKKHLKQWMKPKYVSTPFMLFGTRSSIHHEPKGCCLIISPWNYPFQLAIGPLIAAISAGNSCIIKPSEFTPNTSRILKEIMNDIFEEKHVAVIEGGKEISQSLLNLPFDHIFFTGSPQIGKLVMQAAANHLTSVTLELGGKSPAIIDETADIKSAVNKIIFGKFINAGQTCVAPDYVLIDSKIKAQFIYELKNQLDKKFKDGHYKDYSKIISHSHIKRLYEILDDSIQNGATIAWGGQINIQDRLFGPTILDKVKIESRLMKEEIFGPILPIIEYSNETEMYDIVSKNPNPLACYIFSQNKQNQKNMMSKIKCGGMAINETLLHLAHPELPFGGRGESGLGSYHGYFGFKTFSHEKAIMERLNFGFVTQFLTSPYSEFKLKIVKLLTQKDIL